MESEIIVALKTTLYELKNRRYKATNPEKCAYWDKEIEKIEKEILKYENN